MYKLPVNHGRTEKEKIKTKHTFNWMKIVFELSSFCSFHAFYLCVAFDMLFNVLPASFFLVFTLHSRQHQAEFRSRYSWAYWIIDQTLNSTHEVTETDAFWAVESNRNQNMVRQQKQPPQKHYQKWAHIESAKEKLSRNLKWCFVCCKSENEMNVNQNATNKKFNRAEGETTKGKKNTERERE